MTRIDFLKNDIPHVIIQYSAPVSASAEDFIYKFLASHYHSHLRERLSPFCSSEELNEETMTVNLWLTGRCQFSWLRFLAQLCLSKLGFASASPRNSNQRPHQWLLRAQVLCTEVVSPTFMQYPLQPFRPLQPS